MKLSFDYNSVESYRQFLTVRKSPVYHFAGRQAIIPDEYAAKLGLATQLAVDDGCCHGRGCRFVRYEHCHD